MKTSVAFADFVATERIDGLRQALGKLLRLTDYRFIGIWRFQDGKAGAAAYFDRENPDVESTDEVPETATYCCFVRDEGASFKTRNALLDERLASHAAREAVLTYCGVPIMDSEGTILGTLCHYDLVPRDPEQINLELMLMVASYLANNALVPPYPAANA